MSFRTKQRAEASIASKARAHKNAQAKAKELAIAEVSKNVRAQAQEFVEPLKVAQIVCAMAEHIITNDEFIRIVATAIVDINAIIAKNNPAPSSQEQE